MSKSSTTSTLLAAPETMAKSPTPNEEGLPTPTANRSIPAAAKSPASVPTSALSVGWPSVMKTTTVLPLRYPRDGVRSSVRSTCSALPAAVSPPTVTEALSALMSAASSGSDCSVKSISIATLAASEKVISATLVVELSSATTASAKSISSANLRRRRRHISHVSRAAGRSQHSNQQASSMPQLGQFFREAGGGGEQT